MAVQATYRIIGIQAREPWHKMKVQYVKLFTDDETGESHEVRETITVDPDSTFDKLKQIGSDRGTVLENITKVLWTEEIKSEWQAKKDAELGLNEPVEEQGARASDEPTYGMRWYCGCRQ